MGASTAAIVGGVVGIGANVASAVAAKNQADDAKDAAAIAQGNLEMLQNNRQEVINPYANLTNQYANLGVATGAAEMQAEEADIALANTLDTLRATGASAGGATALAMAALKSKQQVSANIEQQEVANQKLRAEGQMQVERAIAEGEKFKWNAQENREMIELDRAQGLIDKHEQQQAASNAAMWGAIGNIGNVAMTTGMNITRAQMGQGIGDDVTNNTPTTTTTNTTTTTGTGPTNYSVPGGVGSNTSVTGGSGMGSMSGINSPTPPPNMPAPSSNSIWIPGQGWI
tara:strand:- start:17007 stop:17864 length:858 start_codon:yes stop_codon:yes gene_type:complete